MSEQNNAVERIWVNISQAARLTGYRAEYIREIALSTWRLPEEERPLKLRFRSSRYEFWLPDLTAYLETSGNPAGKEQPIDPEKIWVTTPEAAEITGYSFGYMKHLAMQIWHQPEEERTIRIRSRSHRNEFWLPDLLAYVKNIGHGPHSKPSKKNI